MRKRLKVGDKVETVIKAVDVKSHLVWSESKTGIFSGWDDNHPIWWPQYTIVLSPEGQTENGGVILPRLYRCTIGNSQYAKLNGSKHEIIFDPDVRFEDIIMECVRKLTSAMSEAALRGREETLVTEMSRMASDTCQREWNEDQVDVGEPVIQ